MDEKEEQGKKRWKRKKTSLRSMTGRDLSLSFSWAEPTAVFTCVVRLSLFLFSVCMLNLLTEGWWRHENDRQPHAFFFLFYSLAFKVLVSSDKITTEAFFFSFYIWAVFFLLQKIFILLWNTRPNTHPTKRKRKKKKISWISGLNEKRSINSSGGGGGFPQRYVLLKR